MCDGDVKIHESTMQEITFCALCFVSSYLRLREVTSESPDSPHLSPPSQSITPSRQSSPFTVLQVCSRRQSPYRTPGSCRINDQMLERDLMLYLLFVSLLNGATAFAPLKRQRTGVFIHGRKAIVGAKSKIHSITLLHALLPRISVSQVQSNVDILSLADLRYKEWILQDDINNTDKASPSQHSFRLATAEICQERRKDGAIAFLAKYYNGNEEIVGAAELSPIETRGCIRSNNDAHLKSAFNTPIAMYATDIVTSSSHRRLGIGSKLMNELEDEAWRLGCRFVFLHVEYDNAVAIGFYHRLWYSDVQDNAIDDIGVVTLTFTDEGSIAVPRTSLDTLGGENKDGTRIDEQVPHHETIIVDTRQLAANAGTTGQLLMVKKLKEPNTNDQDDIQSETSASKAAGFGYNAGGFGSKSKTVKKKKK